MIQNPESPYVTPKNLVSWILKEILNYINRSKSLDSVVKTGFLNGLITYITTLLTSVTPSFSFHRVSDSALAALKLCFHSLVNHKRDMKQKMKVDFLNFNTVLCEPIVAPCTKFEVPLLFLLWQSLCFTYRRQRATYIEDIFCRFPEDMTRREGH